jgi:hypothetical protein
MTTRRRAPALSRAPGNFVFPSLIPIFFFTLPSILAQVDPAQSGAQEGSAAAQLFGSNDMLMLAFLSAVTFVFWRYHRRDYASPRRIGRRI